MLVSGALLLGVLIGGATAWSAALRALRGVTRQDVLTGLGNRAALAEYAARCPSHRQLALFLLDVDRFKRVNDQLGHLAGDQVLCTVADRLDSFVDDLDLPGIAIRLGGDEFVAAVQLPLPPAATELGAAKAAKLSTELHDKVAGPVLAGPATAVDVDVSVGASSGAPDNLAGLTHGADLAMYAAKQGPWASAYWPPTPPVVRPDTRARDRRRPADSLNLTGLVPRARRVTGRHRVGGAA